MSNTDLGVLLIPNVGPLDGGNENSDYHYMRGLIQNSSLARSSRVKLVSGKLNAAQLKHLISKCRFFIGARTHATIAALSTGVPTVSIAYSIKAKGINLDLFGNLDHVLETPSLSKCALVDHLGRLLDRETELRKSLLERSSVARENSYKAVRVVLDVLI